MLRLKCALISKKLHRTAPLLLHRAFVPYSRTMDNLHPPCLAFDAYMSYACAFTQHHKSAAMPMPLTMMALLFIIK